MVAIKRVLAIWLILCLIGFNLTLTAMAQTLDDSLSLEEESGSGYYLSPGLEGQFLMKINVWGEVSRPGVYEVTDNSDLISVISVAGGPTDAARLTKVKLIRNYAHRKQIIKFNLKKYLNDAAMKDVPKILPGDTVVIPKNRLSSTTMYVTVLYNLAIIALAINAYVK